MLLVYDCIVLALWEVNHKEGIGALSDQATDPIAGRQKGSDPSKGCQGSRGKTRCLDVSGGRVWHSCEGNAEKGHEVG